MHYRYNDENVIYLGLIPGPKNPKDLDSFLIPLRDEMKQLEVGIPNTYNGFTKEPFDLRAHICVIGSDIPARKKLTHTSGAGFYNFCLYCKSEAVGSGKYCYCPFTPPKDNLPPQGTAARRAKYQRKDPNANLRKPVEKGQRLPTYEPAKLELRTHEEFARAMEDYVEHGDRDRPLLKKAGVIRYSIFLQLKSIKFPRSFPYDGMHLWFENIMPRLFNHWQGRFNMKKGDEVVVIARVDQDDADRTVNEIPGGKRKRNAATTNLPAPANKRLKSGSGQNGGGGRTSASDIGSDSLFARRFAPSGTRKSTRLASASEIETGYTTTNTIRSIAARQPNDKNQATRTEHGQKPVAKRKIAKFEQSGEPFCIEPVKWKAISSNMDKTKKKGLIPSVFGTDIRAIYDHVHQWKAEEWKHWTLRYSLIYLKGVLPDNYYKPFEKLVRAITICCRYELQDGDIEMVSRIGCSLTTFLLTL